MIDEHKHVLVNYYWSPPWSMSETLLRVMREDRWDGSKVWWCPVCKIWSLR